LTFNCALSKVKCKHYLFKKNL